MKNEKVIVRCDRSGVFYGEIESRNGSEAKIINCRCIWSWKGANSLMELALNGTKKPEDCRFTVYLKEITVLDVIQILPCTKKAINSIEGVKEWVY